MSQQHAISGAHPLPGAPKSTKVRSFSWSRPLYAVLFLIPVVTLVAMANTGFPYKAGSDLGYNLGLIGGVLMLSLLLYPLRKRIGFMDSWLPMKVWFQIHMFFGIAGPTLILFHSTFVFQSVNSIVAFVSMSIVALSGFIGRFIYTRVHHGLYGQQATLKELQFAQFKTSEEMLSDCYFPPAVAERLKDFESWALMPRKGFFEITGSYLGLAPRALKMHWDLYWQARQLLSEKANTEGWDSEDLRMRIKRCFRFIHAYLHSVSLVAHFGFYKRMFSLWHALHIPLMFLLVVTGIIHVIAVHMY